jgi:hypothetical protein
MEFIWITVIPRLLVKFMAFMQKTQEQVTQNQYTDSIQTMS